MMPEGDYPTSRNCSLRDKPTGGLMTETEYLIATDRAKLMAAVSLLRDVYHHTDSTRQAMMHLQEAVENNLRAMGELEHEHDEE